MNPTAIVQQQDVASVDAIADHLAPSAPFFELVREHGDGPLARRNSDQGVTRAFFDFVQRLRQEGYGPLLRASIRQGSRGSAVYRVAEENSGSCVELALDVMRDGEEFYTASIKVGKPDAPEVLYARGDNDSRLARNLYEKFFA